jgi:hypothetical protein
MTVLKFVISVRGGYCAYSPQEPKNLPASLTVKQIVIILGSWWRVNVSLLLLQTMTSKAGALRVIIAKRCSMCNSQ